MTAHRLYNLPCAERVALAGTDAALLRWDDAEGSAAWGFEHVCRSWPDAAEVDSVLTTIPAPRLSKHTVTRTGAGVTVRASILCPDCGTHGFVTDSRWKAA